MTDNPIRGDLIVSNPTPTEWGMIVKMGERLHKSRLLPDAIKTPEMAVAIIVKGRELGIPAMQSFSHIYIVDGKPACSSELMLALLARGSVTWNVEKDGTDRKEAIFAFHRPGWPAPYRSIFTLEDAKQIMKKEKGNWKPAPETWTWKQYLPNMLRARCIANGARIIGPDLLAGMSHTIEEVALEADRYVVEVEAQEVASEVTKEEMSDAGDSEYQEELAEAVSLINSARESFLTLPDGEAEFNKEVQNFGGDLNDLSLDKATELLENLRSLYTGIAKQQKEAANDD